jgi:hypothetical protein
MTDPHTSKETPLHKPQSPLRRGTRKLTRVTPVITLLMLLLAAPSQAEDNPNNYQCAGHILAGTPEEGSSEAQVRYTIACSGPISGYAIQTQAPVRTTGFESAPLVTNEKGEAVTTDSFSCNGELPGSGFNCVGNTTAGFETITGQFAIASKLCAQPRVDPHLTVTYAYLNEKKVITQAISGPFDLGRPHGCPTGAVASKKGKHHGKGGSRKRK